MTQLWVGTGGVTVTGSGTIATVTGASPGYCCFGSEGFTTGKYYFEVVVTGAGFTGTSSGVGLGNTSSSTAANQDIGGLGGTTNTDTVGVLNNGNTYNAGSQVPGTGGTDTYASGDNIGIALDLTDGVFWYRVNGVRWCGGTSGGVNPGTPSTGSVLPSATIAHPVVPAVGLKSLTTPDSAVGKFAQSSWTYSAPTGFGPFDAVAAASHNLPLLGVGNMIGWRATLPLIAAWKTERALRINARISRRKLLLINLKTH